MKEQWRSIHNYLSDIGKSKDSAVNLESVILYCKFKDVSYNYIINLVLYIILNDNTCVIENAVM